MGPHLAIQKTLQTFTLNSKPATHNTKKIENQKIELANIKLKDDMTVHKVLHRSPLKIKGVPKYMDTLEVKPVLHYPIP